MYGKIHQSIYDSSVAEKYMERYIFQDMVILSDKNGVLDMTLSAFCRRINVPPEVVEPVIKRLMQPDPQSKTTTEDGRRIKLIDPDNRTWGWIVINKPQYRNLLSVHQKREKEAIRQRRSYWRKQLKEEGKSTAEIEAAILLLEQTFQETSRLPHAPSLTSPHTNTDTYIKNYRKDYQKNQEEKTCQDCGKQFISTMPHFKYCPICFKKKPGRPNTQPPTCPNPSCSISNSLTQRINFQVGGCNYCMPDHIGDKGEDLQLKTLEEDL